MQASPSLLRSRRHRPRLAQTARRALGTTTLPVTLRFWDGSVLEGGEPVLEVRSPDALSHLLHSPNQIGLARAWVSGALDVDSDADLEAIIRLREDITAEPRATVRRCSPPPSGCSARASSSARRSPPSRPGARAACTRSRATRPRSSITTTSRTTSTRCCSARAWSTRARTSPTPGESLEAAQERKLELICAKLRLQPGERLLDIGCGWGSLLIHAARHHGVRGVGVTLSDAQAALARERVREAGLSDRIEIRVQDYRELDDGPFDKIASVGMYEHVGRGELDHYARTVHALLKPGGLFLNHGIARLHSEAPDKDTFIYRYVFPDGELSPVTDVLTSLESAGLEVRDVESLREHYPLTLRRWLANLDAHREEAVADIGVERERVWRLYMLASALGFEAGDVTVYQTLTTRPGAPHGLPLRREGAVPRTAGRLPTPSPDAVADERVPIAR